MGALIKGPGFDSLPVSVVSIGPPGLAPTEMGFDLRADATGRRGGTVWMVESSTGAAAPVMVTGSITVP